MYMYIVCRTFEGVFVDIETVCIFLLGEDESLVHEEEVPVGPRPPRLLVHIELVLVEQEGEGVRGEGVRGRE